MRSTLSLVAAVAAVAAIAAITVATARPAHARGDKPLNLSDLRDKMTAYHDGQGHYLIVPKEVKNERPRYRYFYGDGKRFYEMSVYATSNRDGGVHADFNDPRFVRVSLVVKDTGATAHCRRTADQSSITNTELPRVPAADAARLINKAAFFGAPFKRTPHALARDTMGVYYYVDHAALAEGAGERRDYHLYIGTPGSMKRQRLVSVADDSVGQVFATRAGALQVRWGKKGNRWRTEAFAWIKANRKDRIDLTNVPAYLNHRVIFETLLVYGAVRYGTHCDDL